MLHDFRTTEMEQDYAEDREREISSMVEERVIHPSEAEQLIEDRSREANEQGWDFAIISFNNSLSTYRIRRIQQNKNQLK